MKKDLIPLLAIPLCISIVGCGSDHLMDNAPAPTQVYFAATEADIAACGTIEVSGKIVDFSIKPSQDTTWSKESNWFHIGLKTGGYERTQWKDDEIALETDSRPDTMLMKRPGTYSYNIRSLSRYDWKFDILCKNSGKMTSFVQSGSFKESYRAVVMYLSTSQGSVSINLKEFSNFMNSSTPTQMNLP